MFSTIHDISDITHAHPYGDFTSSGLELADAKRLKEIPSWADFKQLSVSDRAESSLPLPVPMSETHKAAFEKYPERDAAAAGSSPTVQGAVERMRARIVQLSGKVSPLKKASDLTEEGRSVLPDSPELREVIKSCDEVLSIGDRDMSDEMREKIYSKSFFALEQFASIQPFDKPLSIYDKNRKFSELDFIVSQRHLPEPAKSQRWIEMKRLLTCFKFDESTREGRQQIAAMLIAAAYTRVDALEDEFASVVGLVRPNIRASDNRSAAAEMVKKVLLISDEGERAEVIHTLSEHCNSVDEVSAYAFNARLVRTLETLKNEYYVASLYFHTRRNATPTFDQAKERLFED